MKTFSTSLALSNRAKIDAFFANYSLDRGAELRLPTAVRHVRDYLTRDVDPKSSDRHISILLASVIHPDAVGLRDECPRQVARYSQFVSSMESGLGSAFLAITLLSLRPWISRRAPAA
jgi:hypothetical protein